MSYILDALKKAERDRQQTRVPTVGTIHVVTASRRRPVWPWIAGGAVLANALVVGSFVARDRGLTARRDVVATSTTVAAPASTPAPEPAALPSAPAAVAAAPAPSPAATVPIEETVKRRVPARSSVPRPTVDTASAEPTRVASTGDGAPASRTSPADLKLEVLIYSDSPAGRAVYINGRRYVEGSRTPTGYLVEQIREDGVLIRGDGREFVLRQQ